MKYVRLLLLSLIIWYPAQNIFSQIRLLDAKESAYVVVLPTSYNTAEKKAADVLRYFFKKATSFNLPVVQGVYEGKSIFIKEDASLPTQAVWNYAENGNFVISGGIQDGVLHAAIHFIKQVLHIDWLGTGAIYYPPLVHNLIIPIDYSYDSKPDFITRTILGHSASDGDYRMGNFLQNIFEGHYSFAHTFNSDMLPKDSFFLKHPEYYALVGNNRVSDQPCLTNNEVYEIVKRNIAQKINNKGNNKYSHYSISLDDNTVISTDKESQIIMKRNGDSYMGVVLEFVNNIAANFQDKKFTTLAYMTTKKPPTIVRPFANVQIILTNADYDKSKSLEKGGFDVQQKLDMNKVIPEWVKIDSSLILWDYVANFTEPFCPWPIVNTFKPNLQFYKSVGVKNLFIQDAGLFPGSMSDLKSYLLSNLMWNVNLDTDSLAMNFCQKYYGRAYKQMHQYFKEMNEISYYSNQAMLTYDYFKEYKNTIFTYNNIKKWQSLLKTALSNAKNYPEYKRVLIEWLALDYLKLTLIQTSETWMPKSEYKKSQLIAFKKDFCRKCAEYGIIDYSKYGIKRSYIEH